MNVKYLSINDNYDNGDNVDACVLRVAKAHRSLRSMSLDTVVKNRSINNCLSIERENMTRFNERKADLSASCYILVKTDLYEGTMQFPISGTNGYVQLGQSSEERTQFPGRLRVLNKFSDRGNAQWKSKYLVMF